MENKKTPAELNSNMQSISDILKARDKKTAYELERRNAHLKMKTPATELPKDSNSL